MALALLLLASTALFAAPYGPEGMSFVWKQPDGAQVKLKAFGDEYYARIENGQGYTVVLDRTDNTYYYAKLSQDGESFVATNYRADGPPPESFDKKVELPREVIKAKELVRRNALVPDQEAEWVNRVQAARARRELKARAERKDNGVEKAPSAPSIEGDPVASLSPEAEAYLAPVSGSIVALCIVTEFPDDPATVEVDPLLFPTTSTKVERYCNELGYNDDGNSGSIRDYFRDQSLNQLDYTHIVTDLITLPNPRDYYDYSDYPTNTTLRSTGASGRLIVSEAIQVLKDQNFDFSALTVDASDRVISTNLFFAGNATSFDAGLWPHKSAVSSIDVGTTGSPMYIRNYQITNANSANLKIGVYIHETGHLLLGYPDLYGNGSSIGVGNHCLMGTAAYLNNTRTPAPINGYLKDVSGWSNVVDITAEEFLSTSLPTTGNNAYRIRKPGTNAEYFFVENRGNGDPWAAYCVDKGIMIWHIDETKNGSFYGDMTEARHYEVSLEQADGDFDLENNVGRGDSLDLYDNTTQAFNDTTLPDALWWDGSTSGIQIEVLSAPGSSMDVEFGVMDTTIVVTAPDGGESLFTNTSTTLTWDTLIAGNVKIELFKNQAFVRTVVSTTPNDGSYLWAIPTNIPAGSDYRIKITSIEEPSTTDQSAADFTISPQPVSVYSATMNTDPGWAFSNSSWAYGQPTGGEQDEIGLPDPTSGFTGPNVIGYALDGDYEPNIAVIDTRWAKTPAIDCSHVQDVSLSFYRWLGIEGDEYDNVYIEVSNDDANWTTVWENGSVTLDDGAWTQVEYDISAVADGQSTVYIRWGLGVTDGSWNYCGWNIDDVIVEGTPIPTSFPVNYVDAVSGASGNTFATVGSLSDTNWLNTDAETGSDDDQWRKRAFANGGTIFQSWTLNTGNQAELTTEITGLTDGVYNVWVFFWDSTGSNTWNISAGLTSGSLDTYSFDGLGDTASPIPATDLSFTVTPMRIDGTRTMYGVNLGQASVSGGSAIEVFIDGLHPDSNDRVWYDGVGYSRVGNINSEPVFTVDPIAGTDADASSAYVGSVAGSATDVDDDQLTYAKVSGPAWLSIAADGTLSGTPTNSDIGANVFTISVTDSITAPVNATLNITVTGSAYGGWATTHPSLSDDTPDVDFDTGGTSTGLEWVLGGDPTNGSDDTSILPTVSNDPVTDMMVITFRRSDQAFNDPNTTITLEYGSNLLGWTAAVHNGTTIIFDATDDGAGVGVDLIEVSIDRSLVTGSKIFARLHAVVNP